MARFSSTKILSLPPLGAPTSVDIKESQKSQYVIPEDSNSSSPLSRIKETTAAIMPIPNTTTPKEPRRFTQKIVLYSELNISYKMVIFLAQPQIRKAKGETN